MPKLSAFAERIKTCRKAIGKTQTEIAALAGIRPSTYSHYEQGCTGYPSSRSVLAMANALGVPPASLWNAIEADMNGKKEKG
jgi:transcriptional regulator with XRE-family HTH domain